VPIGYLTGGDRRQQVSRGLARAFLAGVWNTTATGPTKAVVINKNGRLATGPAPAAPVSAQAQTVSRLRAALHKQRIDNHRQDAAIQRLQREVRAGG